MLKAFSVEGIKQKSTNSAIGNKLMNILDCLNSSSAECVNAQKLRTVAAHLEDDSNSGSLDEYNLIYPSAPPLATTKTTTGVNTSVENKNMEVDYDTLGLGLLSKPNTYDLEANKDKVSKAHQEDLARFLDLYQ